MGNDICPYCKEEIKADAIVCKHCHAGIFHSKKEMTLNAIAERMSSSSIFVSPTSFGSCKIFCHATYGHFPNKRREHDCLNDCIESEMDAIMIERIIKTLYDYFLDIIWMGGDIDPIPIEKMFQDYFSKLRKKIPMP